MHRQSDIDTVVISGKISKTPGGLTECPHCKSLNIGLSERGRVMVLCLDCGAQGPEFERGTNEISAKRARAKAVVAWNKRGK